MHDVLVIGGGNSQHVRDLRCVHDGPQDVLVDACSGEEFRRLRPGEG